MPEYKKFPKSILFWKKGIDPFATVKLKETCFTVSQLEIPMMRDSDSALLPCSIAGGIHTKCLCDMGASITLVSLSLFRRLGIGEKTLVRMSLQLADISTMWEKGNIDNLLMKVGNFVFLADFVIVDIKEDPNVPRIFGRPLLKTMHVNVNLKTEELTIRVHDDSRIYKAFHMEKWKKKLVKIKFREDRWDPYFGLHEILQPDPPKAEKMPEIARAHAMVLMIKDKKMKEMVYWAKPP